VFREGQRSADRYFTVLYCSNGSSEPRLGFAISRQRVRLAVGRNRLRRLVRESFRHIRPELPGVDIVVMARDTAGKASAEELGGSLARHWERLQRAGGRQGNKSNNGSKDGNAEPSPRT
jgi:ribonuclease P protein component